MSHKLLEEDPALVRIARELAKLDEAMVADAHRREQASSGYWAAMAKHAEVAEAAMLDGKAPPPPPEMPVVSGDPGIFSTRRRALVARRQETLADRSELLLRSMLWRENEILEAAREAAAVIDKLADEAQALAAAVGTVRLASGDGSPVYRYNITASVLLSMLEQGVRPSAPSGPVSDNAMHRVVVS